MNGEGKSPNDFIKDESAILDKFEKQCALPDCNSPGSEDELNDYLNMSREKLKGLTPVECSEIGYKLSQYSFYIQRVYNRQQERINWIETQINKMVAPKISNYPGNWTMSRQSAILDNEAAKRFQEIQLQCQQRKDRLEYLSKGITNMVDQLRSLSFAKQKEMNDE